MWLERRGRVGLGLHHGGNWRQEDAVSAADKPFSIDKKLVYEAYKAVRANAGGAGVDRQTIEQFEAELGDNLYKLWNRMSSGSYFPPPVRAVAIPKKSGGQRLLGVPTVADRVAQMVVKRMIEAIWRRYFWRFLRLPAR